MPQDPLPYAPAQIGQIPPSGDPRANINYYLRVIKNLLQNGGGGGGGAQVFVQPNEPVGAPDGSLWYDTDAASGGGAWSPFNPDEPPGIPHAMDDEFSETVLNAKWGYENAQNAVLEPLLQSGMLNFKRLATGNNANAPTFILQNLNSNADWHFRAKFILRSKIEGVAFGLAFKSNGLTIPFGTYNFRFAPFVAGAYSVSPIRYTDAYAYDNNYRGDFSAFQGPVCYLGMRREGTKLFCEYSPDGVFYTTLHKWDNSDTIFGVGNLFGDVIEKVGLVASGGIAHPFDSSLSCEWFRRIA